jgi:hypothetical protein
LIPALIIAAVFPSIVLGAIWLGLSGGTKPEQTAAAPEASKTPSAILTTSERIDAAAGGQISFPIALDGTDGVPSRSVIAIKGLPAGTNFSEGRPFGASEWTLKPDQIGDLQLVLPPDTSGEFRLEIALISPGNEVITEAETLLGVAPAPVPVERSAAEPGGALSPPAGEPATMATLLDDSQATGLTAGGDVASGEGAEPEPVQQATETATATTGELPSADAVENIEQASEQGTVASGAQPSTVGQPASGETGLGTVEPSVFVNMREEPSSSSPVLGVVAKGATLPVLDRKRGWVQVSDAATGKTGWIYSGLLVGEARSYTRKKRAASAETKSGTNSESFWDRVGRWLTPDSSSASTQDAR